MNWIRLSNNPVYYRENPSLHVKGMPGNSRRPTIQSSRRNWFTFNLHSYEKFVYPVFLHYAPNPVRLSGEKSIYGGPWRFFRVSSAFSRRPEHWWHHSALRAPRKVTSARLSGWGRFLKLLVNGLHDKSLFSFDSLSDAVLSPQEITFDFVNELCPGFVM